MGFKKAYSSLILLFCLQIAGAQIQKDPENKSQEFSVGFSIIDLQDYARSYLPQSPGFRPIQLSIWYPAAKVKTTMQFRDYFQTWKSSSIRIVDSLHYAKNYKEWLQGLARSAGKSTAPDSLVTLVGNQSMRAGWNAPAAKGKFPVIISHGGGGDAFSQAIRNEYFASQGYVVISLPLLNHAAIDFNRGTNSVASMLSMAQDIGFVINYCRTLAYADAERIGFTGMHMQTGLTYQSIAGKLLAVVVFEDGLTPLSLQPYYDPKAITTPILAIGSEELRPDFSLLDSLQYAERFILRFPSLKHIDNFQNDKILKLQKPGSGKNYDTLNLFIRQFFDLYLKRRPAAEAFIAERTKFKAGDPGVGLLHQRASPPLPTEAEFLAMIRFGKLQEARAIFEKARGSGAHTSLFSNERFTNLLLQDRFHKSTDELLDMTTMLLEVYPSAPVSERFLNAIGYAYLQQKKTQRAIEVFQLGVQHFPQSPNAFDALADAYAAAGDKDNTIAHSKKVLSLLASSQLNAETRQRIEQSANEKLLQFGAK